MVKNNGGAGLCRQAEIRLSCRALLHISACIPRKKSVRHAENTTPEQHTGSGGIRAGSAKNLAQSDGTKHGEDADGVLALSSARRRVRSG
jgi:hypothetical protein